MRKPRTVHAGIDVKCCVERSMVAVRQCRPVGDFFQRIQNGRQRMASQGGRSASGNSIEHEYAFAWKQFANRDALLHTCNEEAVRAGIHQRMRHWRQSQSVGICLYDRRHSGGSGAPQCFPKICSERSEPHGQLGGGRCRTGRRNHFSIHSHMATINAGQASAVRASHTQAHGTTGEAHKTPRPAECSDSAHLDHIGADQGFSPQR